MRYVCSICGYVYDETGNTPWAELPGDWKCPLCGAAKSDFAPEGAPAAPEAADAVPAEREIRPLTELETAALCSNLAKGCEKQYLADQAAAFRKLADWFASRAQAPGTDISFEALLQKIGTDLGGYFPDANSVSQKNRDRGALRSLTWSEKVTRILRSLLIRYGEEGDAMLENTGVYVCTICGFVYVGDELPEVCPVCKVPNRKFEKIGGESA